MQREGVFREMKQRRSYEKPSERKNREKSEAIRRARKLARKKAQRDGLIPDTRKKKLLDEKKATQRPGYRSLPSTDAAVILRGQRETHHHVPVWWKNRGPLH